MEEVTIIGIDLAKNVFQLHGAAADGRPVFRKKLTRLQFQRFMAAQPPRTVAIAAITSSAPAMVKMPTFSALEPVPIYVPPSFL